MATLNSHAARSRTAPSVAEPGTDGSARPDDELAGAPGAVRRTRIDRRRRKTAPRSHVAYAIGVATVCAVAFGDLVAGPVAAGTQEQSESVAVAEALGIEDVDVDAPVMDDSELLGQLAASRAERDAEQATAAASQAQAEQAAIAARAEAERVAAEARAAAEAAAKAATAAAATTAASAGSSAAASLAGTTATAIAKITNSAGPVRSQTQAAANAFVSNVPGADAITIGGTRASATDPNGHPSGLALDIMVLSDIALGNAIVEYHRANWDELGVEYLIYRQRMLSSPNGSWQPMENRGDATANHMDHVHVNYRG